MGLFTPYSFLQQKVAEAAPSSPYAYRTDAYSSYLKLAIPGSTFTGLITDAYDDVHADIAGTGTNFQYNLTGSASEIFLDTDVKWAAEDYATSIYAQDAGSWGGILDSEMPFSNSNFCVEGWVYMDERFTKPPYWKVGLRQTNYRIDLDFGFPGSGTTDMRGRIILNDTQFFSSNLNISYNLNQWYHVAWVRSGSNLYFYWNGTRYSCGTSTLTVTANGYYRIFTGENSTNDGTMGSYQDFRVYIGTEKGYTTSTITTPNSIVEKL